MDDIIGLEVYNGGSSGVKNVVYCGRIWGDFKEEISIEKYVYLFEKK